MTPAEELARTLKRLAGAELSPAEARSLLGPLHAVLGAVVAQAVQPPPPEAVAAPAVPEEKGERILTVRQLAERFGKSKWWVYSRVAQSKKALPGYVPLPGGRFGFREKTVERWIQRRSNNDT